MKKNRIAIGLAALNISVIVYLVPALSGLMNTAGASILILAFGILFFSGFYIFGQDKRPRPPADLVTGLRLAAGMVFFLLVKGGNLSPPAALIMVFLIEIADGIDGKIARRRGPTVFGGVWDMESDAFIILLFSLSAYWFAGLPPWSLVPGVIRYTFYFPILFLKPEGARFPRSLSWFSKTVCVITVFTLASPWYLPEAAPAAILITSVLITASFLWETVFYIYLRFHTRKR